MPGQSSSPVALPHRATISQTPTVVKLPSIHARLLVWCDGLWWSKQTNTSDGWLDPMKRPSRSTFTTTPPVLHTLMRFTCLNAPVPPHATMAAVIDHHAVPSTVAGKSLPTLGSTPPGQMDAPGPNTMDLVICAPGTDTWGTVGLTARSPSSPSAHIHRTTIELRDGTPPAQV